jgi:hypothetical protein
MINWFAIELESKKLSPWLEDVSTAAADWYRINPFGLRVCEVAKVNGLNEIAGRVMFGEWGLYPTKEDAFAALSKKALDMGFQLSE